MKKQGFTILELLISIVLITVVLLLLFRVMMVLEVINHDTSYASDDEINRTELLQNIENDFLNYHLNGIKITRNNDSTVIHFIMDEEKVLVINKKSITYDDEVYTLKSNNASYDLCLDYEYIDLENDYYLLNLRIPILIDKKNTTIHDDLELTFLGLKNENTSYLENFSC